MFNSIRYRRESKAWQKRYDALAPKAGDIAPDFKLYDANGENSVCLSDFRSQKPVALIFGSYTWPPYVKGTVSLHTLYLQYRDRVQFLTIYIREAHPLDGWRLGEGVTGLLMSTIGFKPTIDVNDPKTIEERRSIARRCQADLKYEIPTYVDEMDDAISKAYAAKPTRLYLIGLDGRVVYAGGLGPFGFKPPELENAIVEYLARGDVAAS